MDRRLARALRPGDRVAIVSPASPFARDEFDAGVAELARLGFEPAVDERVFMRQAYVSGPAALRAAHLTDVWTDASIAGVFCVRGGYGSMQMLPWLDPGVFRAHAKVFVGYSDITSLLSWLWQETRLVAFHGPMLARRLGHGPGRYDLPSLLGAVATAAPLGPLAPAGIEVVKPGMASGLLLGGTLTALVSSLGTPYAFDPPEGFVLFADDVNERPYRLDRLLTQLDQAGILRRASAIVFNELPGCDEPGGEVRARDVLDERLRDFTGPVLTGFPSGHTTGATMTLPLGVGVTVDAGAAPRLVIEEAAVESLHA